MNSSRRPAPFNLNRDRPHKTKWRLLTGFFGLFVGGFLFIFGIPLIIYILLLIAAIILGWNRRDWLLTAVYLVGATTPFLFIITGATVAYHNSTATLTESCRVLDRAEQRCFDEELRIHRHRPTSGCLWYHFDDWSYRTFENLHDATVVAWIRYIAPMRESYRGPYVARNEAPTYLENRGHQFQLNEPSWWLNGTERFDLSPSLRSELCSIFAAPSHKIHRWFVSTRPFRRPSCPNTDNPDLPELEYTAVQDRLLLVGRIRSEFEQWMFEDVSHPYFVIVAIDLKHQEIHDVFVYY